MKIAHRDIKPQNILVYTKEDSFQLRICDFGVSKDYSGFETDEEKIPVGTIAFHPPEVLVESPFNATKCDI